MKINTKDVGQDTKAKVTAVEGVRNEMNTGLNEITEEVKLGRVRVRTRKSLDHSNAPEVHTRESILRRIGKVFMDGF